MQHEEMVDQVRKLSLVKGDCVVITSTKPIGQEQRHAVGSGMRKVLAAIDLEHVPVLVLDEHLDITILRTGELERSDAA